MGGEQSGPGAGSAGQWRSHGRLVDMASLFVNVVWCVLLQDYGLKSRRYEARVEVTCVSRGPRRYESMVETAAVLPTSGGGGGGGGA